MTFGLMTENQITNRSSLPLCPGIVKPEQYLQMLCLYLPPPSVPPMALLLFKEVLFSQVVFSPPTYPPPPSLPASPAENDSQSIFTLYSSLLFARSTHFPSLSNHPYSPVFNTLLSLSLSLSFPWKCCIRTFKMLSGGGTFA